MRDPTPDEVTFVATYLRTSNPSSAAAAIRPDLSFEELESFGRALLKRNLVKQLIRGALIEQGAMAKAVQMTIHQLQAKNGNGDPLWNVRNLAAERIFRAAGAFEEDRTIVVQKVDQAIDVTPKTEEQKALLRAIVAENGRLPETT